ncbi:MAG: hypothetical protein QM775_24005 [Pirellulales bacterium]
MAALRIDARRVTFAVPTLMVMQHHLRGRRRRLAAQHFVADHRMLLHQFEFVRRQLAGLVQYLLRNPHLADVVQEAAEPEVPQVFGVARLEQAALLNEITLELHADEQRDVTNVRRVAHQVVVEGVELFQHHAAETAALQEVEEAADRRLEVADVDLDHGVAHHLLEVLANLAVELPLLFAEFFINDAFEKLQVATTDPDFINAELFEPALHVGPDFDIALQQVAVWFRRKRNRPRQHHAGLKFFDRNAKH